MKAVYIGAGLDLEPLELPINDFIYIDSQPFSEHGTTAYTTEAVTCTKKTRFRNLFSRPRFLTNLETSMFQKGYKIIKRTGDFIVFTNNTKKIKYYYSCSFPEYVEDELLGELKTCDTIIACGFNPDPVILDYIKPRPTFIGNNNTSYEGGALFGVLHETPGLIRTYLNMDTMDQSLPFNTPRNGSPFFKSIS
jgi:hypothetical protein